MEKGKREMTSEELLDEALKIKETCLRNDEFVLLQWSAHALQLATAEVVAVEFIKSVNGNVTQRPQEIDALVNSIQQVSNEVTKVCACLATVSAVLNLNDEGSHIQALLHNALTACQQSADFARSVLEQSLNLNVRSKEIIAIVPKQMGSVKETLDTLQQGINTSLSALRSRVVQQKEGINQDARPDLNGKLQMPMETGKHNHAIKELETSLLEARSDLQQKQVRVACSEYFMNASTMSYDNSDENKQEASAHVDQFQELKKGVVFLKDTLEFNLKIWQQVLTHVHDITVQWARIIASLAIVGTTTDEAKAWIVARKLTNPLLSDDLVTDMSKAAENASRCVSDANRILPLLLEAFNKIEHLRSRVESAAMTLDALVAILLKSGVERNIENTLSLEVQFERALTESTSKSKNEQELQNNSKSVHAKATWDVAEASMRVASQEAALNAAIQAMKR